MSSNHNAFKNLQFLKTYRRLIVYFCLVSDRARKCTCTAYMYNVQFMHYPRTYVENPTTRAKTNLRDVVGRSTTVPRGEPEVEARRSATNIESKFTQVVLLNLNSNTRINSL